MDSHEYYYENSLTLSNVVGSVPIFASGLFRSKIKVSIFESNPFGYAVMNYELIYDTK